MPAPSRLAAMGGCAPHGQHHCCSAGRFGGVERSFGHRGPLFAGMTNERNANIATHARTLTVAGAVLTTQQDRRGVAVIHSPSSLLAVCSSASLP